VRSDERVDGGDRRAVDGAVCSAHPGPSGLDQHIVTWLTINVSIASVLRALASERRLQILEWLKDPTAHFRPQVDGDLEKDGVCAVLLAEKLGISQPTLSEHMRVLSHAGLVRAKRIKQWTFYSRDERRIQELKRTIARQV
jgi:ArsR family transcriptional regulator